MQVSYEDKERSQKFMIWLAIISMTILFMGLCSYQIVRQAESDWFKFPIPKPFVTSTVLILISSITMIGAQYFVKSNKWLTLTFLIITLTLGAIFAYMQFQGFAALVDADIHFVDSRSSNDSGSLFYVVAGLHWLHLVGGLFALISNIFATLGNKYTAEKHKGLKISAIFWHFLGGLWLFLFLFWQYSDKIF